MNFRIRLALPFSIFAGLIIVTLLVGCKTEPKTEYKYNDNTARIRLAAEPDRINPILSRSGYSRQVVERVFAALMDYDPVTLKLTPFLVESAPEIQPISEGNFAGGTNFIFKIRKEAVWDDGSPVTADDVDFSFKLLFTPGLPTEAYRPYFEFFKEFKKDPVDNRKFTLTAANQYILNEAAAVSIPIYPAKIYDPENVLAAYTLNQLNVPDLDKLYGEKEDLKKFAEQFNSPKFSREKEGVVGCGPYKFEKWETGQYVLLTKKQNWWGSQITESALFQAGPDTILYKIVADQTAAIAALKDQEIDAASSLDPNDFAELKANDFVTKNFNLQTPLSPQIYLIYLNNKDPKLNDKRTRKALAHLMNVDEFITTLYNSLAERVVGPVLPTAEYYNKNLQPIGFDLQKAKDLLKEAGWADSDNNGVLDRNVGGKQEEFEVEILSTGSKASQNMSLFYQNSLKAAGIKANVVTKEGREAMAEVRKKNYQIYPGAMGLDLTLDDFKQQWHTESDQPSGGNYTGFGSAATDSLIESIRTTFDVAKRNELYKEFQAMLYEEQPAIFLFVPQERIAIHKRFEATTSLKRPGFFPNTFKLKKEKAGIF